VAHHRLVARTEQFRVATVPKPSEHVLCRLDELPEGCSRGFDPEGRGQASVFAVRYGGSVHVYADSCPHHGTPLAWRRDAYLNAAGDRIVCAAHGAQFEIDTGLCVLGPCLGDRLTAMAWRLEGGGLVIADGWSASASASDKEAKP
jgi:nitrite reductase/ring-hydroxylating ferredoxin subunit